MRSEMMSLALDRLAERRSRNAAEETRRREQAVAACPEIGELLSARQELIYAGIRGLLQGGEQAQSVPEKMAACNARITQLLKAQGLPEDWLEPVYTCPDCRDTGYAGETLKTPCHCLLDLCRTVSADLVDPAGAKEQSFETFDLGIFPDTPLPGLGVSQRGLMERAEQRCRKWAETWPEGQVSTVLLTGASGLGKTFLLHAMARTLILRGKDTVLLSAYQFIETARRFHMSMDGGELDGIMNAEAVLIDDLGSEPMMNNITLVYLYNLVNERQNRGLATVLSTNLTPEELRQQYSERIASRLTDRRQSLVVELEGEDIRRRR